tara:strand:+ start:401 stop:1069 length:669 start_codon:yes stop_codon:yes gene_type:complete
MDINNVIKDYVQCVTNDAVTLPNGGTWISALCIYYNITEPINGSWIQAYCNYLGITATVNGSWTIALANSMGLSAPVNGSWWWAIADDACNNAGVLPTAEFVGVPLTLNEGSSVTYTDLSSDNGGPAITAWSWQFTGGTPATSVAQNPVIQYNTQGQYDTELTVSNADGADGELKPLYIQVNVAPVDLVINSWEVGPYANNLKGKSTTQFSVGPYINNLLKY